MRVPTADVTTNQYERDVTGNKTDAVLTAVGTTKSVAAYVKTILTALGFVADAAVNTGSSVATAMGYLKALVAGSALAAGQKFTIVKTLVSSAILQTGVDVTLASSGGAMTIEDIILQTNGTGLAAGTLLTLETNNANGILVFFSTVVSGLGANKTINMDSASVAHIRTALESGKKITAKMTVADGTGAGTVDVYMTFRRHVAGATIAAA